MLLTYFLIDWRLQRTIQLACDSSIHRVDCLTRHRRARRHAKTQIKTNQHTCYRCALSAVQEEKKKVSNQQRDKTAMPDAQRVGVSRRVMVGEGRGREASSPTFPQLNRPGGGGHHIHRDPLTFTIASLIISISNESANIRDHSDTKIALTRYGGGAGSVKTYRGRRRGRPSWSRQ